MSKRQKTASAMPMIVSKTFPVLVRAEWSRPAWCREDWCLIRLRNGYRYYSRNEVVEFGEGNTCWVRAECWDSHQLSSRGGITWAVKFTDFDGEGSNDHFYGDTVRPVTSDAASPPPA